MRGAVLRQLPLLVGGELLGSQWAVQTLDQRRVAAVRVTPPVVAAHMIQTHCPVKLNIAICKAQPKTST